MSDKLDPNDLDDTSMTAILEADERTDVPSDTNAERAILASALQDMGAADLMVSILKPTDFYVSENRMLFEICKRVMGSNIEGIDVPTIASEAKKLNLEGAIPPLDGLISGKQVPARARSYAKRITEASIRRGLLGMAYHARRLVTSGHDTGEALAESMAAIEGLQRRGMDIRDEPEDLKDLARDIGLRAIREPKQDIWGYKTGIANGLFDEMTGGIPKVGYWITTGWAGKGKSWLCSSIALGLRRLNPDIGYPLIISSEMKKAASARRILAMAAGVSVEKLLRNDLTEEEAGRVQAAIAEDGALPKGIILTFMAGKDIEAVMAVARQHKRRHGLPLLVIDMASGLSSAGMEGYEKLTAISQRLQRAAEELQTCIIGVVQQKMESYKEGFKKSNEGIMGGMKGTGSWYEDPDVVISLARSNGHSVIGVEKHRETGQVQRLRVEWERGTGRYIPVQPDAT